VGGHATLPVIRVRISTGKISTKEKTSTHVAGSEMVFDYLGLGPADYDLGLCCGQELLQEKEEEMQILLLGVDLVLLI
jgi:hypothetical protein